MFHFNQTLAVLPSPLFSSLSRPHVVTFLMAPSWLLGIPHFLTGGWAPGMLRFRHHWKLTWPPSALCSPHGKFLASRDSGQEPCSRKVYRTFPAKVALLRMWLLLLGSPELPIPTTTSCMASVLGIKAYRSLTTLCPQVPFPTMVALLCMWFGISLPLVYLGYYFGFRKQPYDNPVRTNQIPRQIPEQRWYMNRFVG